MNRAFVWPQCCTAVYIYICFQTGSLRCRTNAQACRQSTAKGGRTATSEQDGPARINKRTGRTPIRRRGVDFDTLPSFGQGCGHGPHVSRCYVELRPKGGTHPLRRLIWFLAFYKIYINIPYNVVWLRAAWVRMGCFFYGRYFYTKPDRTARWEEH